MKIDSPLRALQSTRARAIACSAIAGVLVTVAAVVALRSRSDPYSRNRDGEIILQGAAREEALATEQQYDAEAGLRAVVDRDRVAADLASGCVIFDSDELTTATQERLLCELLAAHILARSSDSPDAYLELAERSPEYRWIDPKLEPNGPAQDSAYQFFTGRALEESTPVSRLRRFWEDVLLREGHLIEASGSGSKGMRCTIRKIRAPDFDRHGGIGHEDPIADAYWNGFGAVAYTIPFLVPREGFQDALQGRPSIVIAECQVILRLRNERHVNWMTNWRWDERLQTWVCVESFKRVSRACVVIF